MVLVKKRLEVKSVAWKVEERSLEKIRHVLQMKNNRSMGALVLGWYLGLEGRSTMIEKNKKTVLCWKMLREARVDVTDVERMVLYQKEWREMV